LYGHRGGTGAVCGTCFSYKMLNEPYPVSTRTLGPSQAWRSQPYPWVGQMTGPAAAAEPYPTPTLTLGYPQAALSQPYPLTGSLECAAGDCLWVNPFEAVVVTDGVVGQGRRAPSYTLPLPFARGATLRRRAGRQARGGNTARTSARNSWTFTGATTPASTGWSSTRSGSTRSGSRRRRRAARTSSRP